MRDFEDFELRNLAHILRNEIVSVAAESDADLAGYLYLTYRTLSKVCQALGYANLNPFNDEDWSLIVGPAPQAEQSL